MSPSHIAGAVAGGIAALGALGAAGAGNALYDFALNPRSKRSMVAMIHAGAAKGVETSPFTGNPQRAEALAWYREARRDVSIPAVDGGGLPGWYVLAEGARFDTGADGVPRRAADDGAGHAYAIICHGYAGDPCDMAVECRLAHCMGASIVTPAARGHERNAGRDIAMGWLDARDLVRWCERVVAFDPEARIALFGVSMGGAEVMMAAGLGLPRQVRCIIEDCGYTSVWDEFAFQMGNTLHLPVSPLLDLANVACRRRAGWDFKQASAVEALARATVPMLFIHGDADAFVPFWMHGKVFEACASPVKEQLIVAGAGHALSSVTDPDRYYGTIRRFLTEHLLS